MTISTFRSFASIDYGLLKINEAARECLEGTLSGALPPQIGKPFGIAAAFGKSGPEGESGAQNIEGAAGTTRTMQASGPPRKPVFANATNRALNDNNMRMGGNEREPVAFKDLLQKPGTK